MPSQTDSNHCQLSWQKLDELYPEHVKALAAANLHPGEYSTLGKMAKWEEEVEETNSWKKKRKNQFKRQTLFPAGYHFNFTKPISTIVMEARNKHNVRYLRPLILHHNFPTSLSCSKVNWTRRWSNLPRLWEKGLQLHQGTQKRRWQMHFQGWMPLNNSHLQSHLHHLCRE